MFLALGSVDFLEAEELPIDSQAVLTAYVADPE
jgi:hypothetical protein